MIREALHLIPYALVAALSPLGFAATIAVLESGRLKALGFAIGFVTGQLATCAVLVAIGRVAPSHSDHYATVQAVIEIVFAVALLWIALRVRRLPPPVAKEGHSERSQAMLDRLGRLHVLTAVVAGLLLGIGGPKRLVLTGLAAASITAAQLGDSADVVLVGFYGALATVLVWAPVLMFEVVGDRAVVWLDAAQVWLARHQRQAISLTLALLGVLLLVDGAIALL